jgi:hypothetical protein
MLEGTHGHHVAEVTQLEADLLYPERPIKVLDQKDRVMRHKIIKFFKIQWTNHTDDKIPEFMLP